MSDAKEEVIATLKRAMECWKSRDFDKFQDLYCDDCVMSYPDTEPVRGKESLRQAVQHMWDSGMSTEYIDTFQFDQPSDDMAITISTYHLVDPKGNRVQGPKVKDFLVWKKIDGKWKVWRDSCGTCGK